MKTNFLYKNALPRGSSVLLKMVLTITALLCCQLMIYGQPVQTIPANGADAIMPVTLEWTTNSTQGVDIEVYECSPPASNSIELGAYELTCSPIVIAGVSDDLSGVTYNPLTNTLFMVENGTPRVHETSLSGEVMGSTLLTGFNDTEGIVHITGTQYAVAEERRGRITFFDIENVSYSNTVQLPDNPPNWSWGPNTGLEGVTYNPAGNGTIHTVKEKEPKGYYSFANPTVFPVGLNTVNTPCNLATNPFGFSDVAGIHHLGLNSGLGFSDHVLMLSEEGKALVETDNTCNEISRISLNAGGANNTLNAAIQQPEGVTMDNNGNLYIVSEPNLLYIFSKRPSGTSIHSASAVTGNSYEIPVQLQTNTAYCWRVKNSDECAWSSPWSFQPIIPGCTNSNACNYDTNATVDDGSCVSATGCDQCDGNGGVIDNPETGTACDDGNICTTNDVIDANCNCTGTFQDTDTDGVCDANDQCSGGDDNIDDNNNGIPDACEDTCPTDLIITNADVPGNYETSYSIETDEAANVVVNLGDQLTLSAGRYVELNQGFDTKPGANFHAYIEGCTPASPKVELTDITSVRHYPNPFSDKVTLELNLDNDAETSINIIDITGRVIHQNPRQQLTSGYHNINLNTNDWIPGTYFYQVFIKENNTGMTKRANGVLVKM